MNNPIVTETITNNSSQSNQPNPNPHHPSNQIHAGVFTQMISTEQIKRLKWQVYF